MHYKYMAAVVRCDRLAHAVSFIQFISQIPIGMYAPEYFTFHPAIT